MNTYFHISYISQKHPCILVGVLIPLGNRMTEVAKRWMNGRKKKAVFAWNNSEYHRVGNGVWD